MGYHAGRIAVVGLALACSGNLSADELSAHARHHGGAKPQLLISTDVAIGLIDTHGGQSLSPGSFDADGTWSNDTDVAPQDIDDGLALAMALNLDAAGLVDVIAVVPTYGNASLPAEMLVARQIVRNLKRRYDIPIVPGATSPASQTLHPAPTWFDGSTVTVEGLQSEVSDEQRQSMQQMMEQMQNMPEAQREMMRQMMGDQFEQIERMLTEGTMDVTVEVSEIRVNSGPPGGA